MGLKKNLILGALYSALAIIVLIITVLFDGDWLSFVYLLLSLSGIYLNSIRIKEGILLFAVSSAFYVYINFVNKFYGEFALYIIIAIYYTVFYFLLKKSSQDGIKSLKPVMLAVFLGAGAVFVPLYMLLLKHLNANQPLINSLLTFLTCIAVITTASRMWQQFIVWMLINAAQMLLWLSTLSGQNFSYLSIIIINVFLFFLNAFNLFSWFSAYRRAKRQKQTPDNA